MDRPLDAAINSGAISFAVTVRVAVDGRAVFLSDTIELVC